MRKTNLSVLLYVLSSLFSTFAWADGPSKFVREWQVYCANNLKCTIATNQEISNFGGIGFERGPQASAPLILFVTSYSDLIQPGSILFSVPGEFTTLEVPLSDGQVDQGTWRFNKPDLVSRIFAAMRAGSKMTMVVNTKEGTKTVSLSLSGVVGAALFVDDVQQRIGNQDALINPGTGTPKPAFTRVKDLSNSSQLPDPVSALWANGIDECGVGFDNQDLIKSYGGFRVSLGEKAEMFILPCGSPGAYNLPFAAYGFDSSTKKARAIQFPTLGDAGPTVMTTAYNVSWNDAKSELSTFFKGRGIGDCGTIHEWVFRGDADYGNFELKTLKRKDDCDERFDDFPVLWPVQ